MADSFSIARADYSLTPTLRPALAAEFARAALMNVVREYPSKLDHVINGAHDLKTPRALHPTFYGSFDWHSCVHMHWLLARLLRLFPDLEDAAEIRAVLTRHFAPANVAAEVAYLEEPSRTSFERPYGWAWLMKLAAELGCWDDADARLWSTNLAPLVEVFVERYRTWLPKSGYPIRHGVHSNSAFGLIFALEYAHGSARTDFARVLEERASIWFANDADYPGAWEPSGEDFLSPALVEAELMRRVLPGPTYGVWLDRFLPQLPEGKPASLFAPVSVSDRTDARIVHLDGLNLSRAWCWHGIAQALSASDPRRERALAAAQAQLAASLPHVVGGDYMAEHWLATYAVLALTA